MELDLTPIGGSILALASGAISAGVVAWLIGRAEQFGLVQVANARSSHSLPTPTGGGIGIVTGTVLAGAVVAWGQPVLLGLLLLATAMALLGLADDRWPLPARVRLVLQAIAVMLFLMLAGAGGMPLPGSEATFLAAGGVLGLAALWWLNLFNFMDGIDGLAASQALFMLGACFLIASLGGAASAGDPVVWLAAITGAATLGFLLHNRAPARIFMGDVGSMFLGFVILALAFVTVRAGWLSLAQWLILGALFVCDASVTLLRRLARGENVMEAHRSHAYQRLSRRWGGHGGVTAAAILANLSVILPATLVAGAIPDVQWVVAGGIYLVIGFLVFRAGAGCSD